MGVRDVLSTITRRAGHARHVECRECGANLAPDADRSHPTRVAVASARSSTRLGRSPRVGVDRDVEKDTVVTGEYWGMESSPTCGRADTSHPTAVASANRQRIGETGSDG
jgi:hypothetical protein